MPGPWRWVGGERAERARRRERAVWRARPEVGESCAVAEVVAVSVDWSAQSELDAAHAERRADADLSELFKAHTSPFFTSLVRMRALSSTPESEPSLDTCEQLSRRERNPDTEPDFEAAREAAQAAEALRASISRSRERQEIVTALVLAGEVAHAERVARCMQQSVQLECPTMAGGCGSDDNFTPITCDSRLCPVCMNRAMGRNIEKYRAQIEAMDHPTLLTLTIENVGDPETGKEAVQGAFGRLRQRTFPSEGKQGEKRYVWATGDDGGEPADHYWKSALCGAGAFDLARRLQKHYVEQDRQIPWKELVDGGVYGIDIKQQEDGTYNVHLHAICDMPYIPQAALSSVWEDLTGAPVVDVRRIDSRGDLDAESALAEVIGYVTKPPEFESVEDEVEYLTALKGARLVQPFGSLHGNTPRVTGLLRCSTCEVAPRWWNYKGLVDGGYDNMEVAGSSADGDRPPPEDSDA
jgi:hypothetical protein